MYIHTYIHNEERERGERKPGLRSGFRTLAITYRSASTKSPLSLSFHEKLQWREWKGNEILGLSNNYAVTPTSLPASGSMYFIQESCFRALDLIRVQGTHTQLQLRFAHPSSSRILWNSQLNLDFPFIPSPKSQLKGGRSLRMKPEIWNKKGHNSRSGPITRRQ
jgi:hypothetical protein